MKNKTPISTRFRRITFNLIGRFLKLKPCSVIFCFHSIANGDWIYSTTPNKFELFVREVLKNNQVVSMDNILSYKEKKKTNKVAITFDDGYENVFTDAYPVLKNLSLTACVFINGFIEKNEDFGYLDERKLMSLKQIRELKKDGWEIGYHSKTHPDLRTLDENALYEEVIRSKKGIEKYLGFEIKYFAYPYGLFNKKVIDATKKAGYEYAFTADGGRFNHKKSPYKISRVLVDKYMGNEDIKIITSCCGLYFNELFTKLLHIKDNLL
jgi:peptidoglycan/xylan/chitin deacetylase (PgdA/CDA1 family)